MFFFFLLCMLQVFCNEHLVFNRKEIHENYLWKQACQNQLQKKFSVSTGLKVFYKPQNMLCAASFPGSYSYYYYLVFKYAFHFRVLTHLAYYFFVNHNATYMGKL